MNSDLTIRPEQPADFAAIRAVVSKAFGQEAEADLVEAIRASAHYIADLALVAEVDQRVVGHTMISGATLETQTGSQRVVMLSPLAVAPSRQRQGIGGALVRAVCEAAERTGNGMVLLEGDPNYYSRFGFEPSFEYGIELPLPNWAPREAGQLLRLSGFDPALSGRVVYPPAFADLPDD